MASAIRTTASYVVIERAAAHRLGRRLRSLERLVADVRRAHADDRALLDTALIELARASGSKDALNFSRRWLHAHRTSDDQGLRIVRPPTTT
jgi:hypothetical protein